MARKTKLAAAAGCTAAATATEAAATNGETTLLACLHKPLIRIEPDRLLLTDKQTRPTNKPAF